VVADEPDRDVGLLGDLGHAQVRLAMGLEVANRSMDEPFAAVRTILGHGHSV